MSKIKTFHVGGIHPDKFKISSEAAISDAPLPQTAVIPVRQHIGAPAKILVKKGDFVKVGSLIADADGIISADVHSSVSGEVIKVEDGETSGGYFEKMITIRVEGDEWEESIDRNPEINREITLSSEEIINIIRQSGVVGMGGAGFPTPVKVDVPEGKKVDCLIINGIECEPYLTADDRLMQECAEQIVIGAKILNKALGIQKAIIAVDENKQKAIENLRKITRSYVGVNVEVCDTKYPQGAEKQLIAAVTGREVPPGCLPIDVNCVVQNAGTAFAVYEAVQKKKPLFERIVTVSGDGIENPMNLRVRIGTPASDLIKLCRPKSDIGKIIFGGPMMGTAVINADAPITKTTSGVLLMEEKSVFVPEEGACIRCATCVNVCPQGLEPYAIAEFTRNGEYQEAKKIHVLDCIECGCCSYSCPARISLLDYCKLAKYEIRKKK
ncbi:MAG: electron transport complex subunit RsxC [Alphaproteobacteria bacterium]|nr:electron transport complex subunit RsxC [Alphaproteobacteria bacterium]